MPAVPTPPPARPRRRSALRAAALLVGVTGAAAAGSAVVEDDTARRRVLPRPTPSPEGHEVRVRDGAPVLALAPRPTAEAAAVHPATGALALSRGLLERATAVVVTSAAPDDVDTGAEVGHRLGLPALVDDPALPAELRRLGTRTVLTVARSGPVAHADLDGVEVVDGTVGPAVAGVHGLPLAPPTDSVVLLLTRPREVPAWSSALLAAVGAAPVGVAGADPRADERARAALRRHPDAPVVVCADDTGPASRLTQRVRTARHAAELPGGGLLPFPGRMMVALYGHPGTSALGLLGEQPAAAAAARAHEVARAYAPLSEVPVVPAFELIATVASGSAGRDRNYSNETAGSVLLPWVEAAERAGTYVVLDLQPGRSDFLTQAKRYEGLLRRPWVGLALDPEWRLGPHEKPLQRIGSVDVAEVNAVGAWLAALVRAHDLPPKVVTLHQFRPSMIGHRERLDTSLDEVQWLVHADGQGGQAAKQGTWAALRQGLPSGVFLGWKNFVDEDHPMLTPRQTMAQVRPAPVFVSYQ